MSTQHSRGIRLAELVAVLSLGTDLGLGQPMEHVQRQCLLALGMADRMGLGEEQRSALYYTALLAFVGCHVDAHEQVRWFGDDLSLKGDARLHDLDGGRAEVAFLVGHLGSGRPPLERLRLGLAFLGNGRKAVDAMFENHWIATEGLATALGLSPAVLEGLEHSFERWDGKGLHRLRGEQISLAARLTTLADVVDVCHRRGGLEAARAAARERSGTQFDPALVALFVDGAGELFQAIAEAPTWDAVIAAEPVLERRLDEPALDVALEAVADFVDVKSPYTLGHSRRVAQLAAEAAGTLGLPADARTLVRRAGLVHDIGRLGVPNSVWDKAAPLTQAERERMRLHPYLSERMLGSSTALAAIAALAGRHHERLDASGYPRGLGGEALSPEARVLAVADVYSALTQPRPHRQALDADAAARTLREEVRAGRLDAPAVDAVLSAAGRPVGRRRTWAAGLTTREVEVLRLLATGSSTREIAAELVISRKTARNHVEHIYAKAGVSNRAQASMFALRHGLLAEDGARAP